ncbi:MAG: hypothetical protein JXR85_11725, partial [Deltaproteobacteria bacterium]|nr:hypothetical protein [Deltaproteobacteria bacterium]
GEGLRAKGKNEYDIEAQGEGLRAKGKNEYIQTTGWTVNSVFALCLKPFALSLRFKDRSNEFLIGQHLLTLPFALNLSPFALSLNVKHLRLAFLPCCAI